MIRCLTVHVEKYEDVVLRIKFSQCRSARAQYVLTLFVCLCLTPEDCLYVTLSPFLRFTPDAHITAFGTPRCNIVAIS